MEPVPRPADGAPSAGAASARTPLGAVLPAGSTLDQHLNARQRDAVLYLDGPCLVLAGAGSGKTRVITQKIAYLLRECGYPARHVVALTFTNKAAREMADRVRTLVNPQWLRGLTVGTFHSLGLRFLREESAAAGLKREFSVLDAHDCQGLIQELLATTDKARLGAVRQSISLWKNALIDPDAAAFGARDVNEVEAARLYHAYQAALRAYQSVDFDDLIRLPAQLLARDEALRSRWQGRVHYLLVDEYQDTNVCQYQLVRLLSGERAAFTVVGDDDQAIYAWRGATAENLARLAQDYPRLRVIKLEQNYRSVQTILQAANRVIANNPKTFDKTLWSELGMGDAITVTPMDTDLVEAESIAMRLSAARFERGARWRDFAVLYRSNYQSRAVEQALRNLRIPYTVSGGQSFFDKAEVRDVLAWLRLIANEDEDPSFIRAATAPRRGIGQATLQALGAEAARRGTSLFQVASDGADAVLPAGRPREAVQEFGGLVQRFQARAAEGEASGSGTAHGAVAADVLDELLAAVDYERFLYDTLDERQARSRWSNVLELAGWLKRKAAEDDLTLLDLVRHVALVTLLERSDDDEPDAVKLSTLHAAKGLEFPHVYLIGVEEGLLPHRGGDEDDEGSEAAAAARLQRIEEERRLMYVGITRAQRTLQLSWCRRRRRGRDDVVCEPSRFIAEMGLQAAAQAPTGCDVDADRTLSRLKDLLRR